MPIVNTLLPVQNVFIKNGRTRGQGVKSIHSGASNVHSRDGHTRDQGVESVHSRTSNVHSRAPLTHSRANVPQGQGPEDASHYDGSKASYESYDLEDTGAVLHDQAQINRWLGSCIDGMNDRMTSVLVGIQSIQEMLADPP